MKKIGYPQDCLYITYLDCKSRSKRKIKPTTKFMDEGINDDEKLIRSLLENSSIRQGEGERSFREIPTQPFKGRHFAVFPEKLAEYCILAGSKEGDIVLDVFSGAATTGKVCLKNNRKYQGYEINADYIKIGYERIEKQLHTKQLSLW